MPMMELELKQLKPADCAAWIEEFIADYRRRHPDYRPPEKSDHPAVIMINLSSEAIDELGDMAVFWMIMIHAMQHWFSPREDCFEYRALKAYFNSSGAMAAQGESPAAEGMERAWKIMKKWEDHG
jgi:hypothetical protein